MAKTNTTIHALTLIFFLFLTIFPISLASKGRLVVHYPHPSQESSPMMRIHQRETNRNNPHTTRASSAFSSTTVPTRTSNQQFHVAAHDVPSGPNPESN
ncbi:hypothetical protein CDL12_25604 [Handroanthus impetiginosus]|uniref:Uncharacterized protein n=1 Tax=Handroanthus impetiginosus TaxID=429701 RepID=A0A2G9G9C5_9LAMI|nr:hypothetical protein CDL12_25604 [Handroanthus impetiginosus]